ncbi:hypothetical protein XPA_003329 [Xanthoria parietina]
MMRISTFLYLFATTLVAARSTRHVGRKDYTNPATKLQSRQLSPQPYPDDSLHPKQKRQSSYLNPVSQKFAVNGSAIPDVDFDIGESYAGLLPISSASNETRELYFWFFPSENPLASDEITIWLNGGPGCSSLEGLLQENGPFLWQYGTFAPVKNPYTWVNLTNMVWVEQPVGTGFSQGTPTATNENEVAEQFLGFFKNFVDTFALQGKKVYITGESYAGYYVPYIANAMLDANDTTYYDVEAILIYDPSTSTDAVQEQIPAVAFVDANANLFALNQSFTDSIHSRAASCNYTSFLSTYLTFPPPGPLPPGAQRLRPGLRPLQRHLRRRLPHQPLLRHLPNRHHLPPPLGRPRLPGLLRLPPRGGGNLLQPHRRPNRHPRAPRPLGRMFLGRPGRRRFPALGPLNPALRH